MARLWTSKFDCNYWAVLIGGPAAGIKLPLAEPCPEIRLPSFEGQICEHGVIIVDAQSIGVERYRRRRRLDGKLWEYRYQEEP